MLGYNLRVIGILPLIASLPHPLTKIYYDVHGRFTKKLVTQP